MAAITDVKEFDNCELVQEFNDVQLLFYKPKSSSKAILFTRGLSNVNQQKIAVQTDQVYAHIELYFLLPSYWDLKKENQQWPIAVLKRMIDGQRTKNVWFGPGDTLTAHPKKAIDNEIEGGALDSINSIFKQTHFILTESMAADQMLKTVSNSSEMFNWLAIVPIFQKEFEFKNSRSALELILKFEKHNVTEELDEHRAIVARKKFFGLF